MKYIVISVKAETSDLVRELPIIFPNTLVHADVARAIQHSEGLRKFKTHIVSAGEISSTRICDSADDQGAHCHGWSDSLGGIRSRGSEDDALINLHDYLAGIK